MTSYEAKCHCGEVEWTAKLSGGAYTLNKIIDKNDLEITKGICAQNNITRNKHIFHTEPKQNMPRHPTTDPTLSGKPLHCCYCANRTTHAYHHQAVLGDKLIARTGLLDVKGSLGFKSAAEIYGKAKYKWEPEIAPNFRDAAA
ncbi:MAG: hypothetical protein LQ340_000400 [Diploschistes diacapsis]|nr:MAG: hypothetical protein LQ340_000400 [Diploschistes diacapsis]